MRENDVRIIRSPNGQNFHRWLEGFGVRARHFSEGRTFHTRPPNVIYGGRTMKRLWLKNAGRAEIVVRSIQASNPRCFDDYSLLAVWHYIGAHAAEEPASEVIGSFAAIDLSRIMKRAHRLAKGKYGRMGKVAEKISSLIANELIPEDEAA